MEKRVNVRLGERSYFIFVKDGLLSHCGKKVWAATSARTVVILSTKNIFKNHGAKLRASLHKEGIRCRYIFIPDGESQKNEKTLFYILEKMSLLGLRRDSCLITLGGGVVGDLGGLAASLYMRGIDFIQCPTTLLAQVDASVGGKTAIDFVGIKNLVGAFHQPRLVLVDPLVLKTLDGRQYRAGLSEVVKYGVIKDPKLFRKMEKNIPGILKRDPLILSSLIERSCSIKAAIVSADEKEEGERARLNYGHTLGHALESFFNYNVITHGEAVAYGMWFASILSFRLGLSGVDVTKRLYSLLKAIGLLGGLPRFEAKKVFEKMLLDKKTRNDGIQFVLTRKIGLVNIQKNIPRPLLLSALNHFQKEVRKPH